MFTARGQHGADWWRSAVIYQVYVRSFHDSDGDGVGDLATEPGVLAFTRGDGFCCIVNCSSKVVALPVDGELLLASHQEAGDKLPPDSAAWYLLAPSTPTRLAGLAS
ncbi:MAG TPA: hypothetical protein VIH10_02840 [Kribbella sp.]